MNIVFMGTPEFAVPTLMALMAHHRVVLVITQPDRKQGRKQRVIFSPVKACAWAHGLEVWQPATLRSSRAVERLRAVQADVFVTAAVGHILTTPVLSLPPHGCLNVHASLLPRWRGAAPVQAAILHGDTETGVTVMLMDEGIDTGPLLAQKRCAILPQDTTPVLTQRLAHLGADLLMDTLPRWVSGELELQPQPDQGVTWCPRLSKSDGCLDWKQSARDIERMVRAWTPWPGAFTIWNGLKLDILQATALPDWSGPGVCGQVVLLGKQVAVITGQGALVLEQVQPAGRRPMSAQAFVCGQRALIGACMETPDSAV